MIFKGGAIVEIQYLKTVLLVGAHLNFSKVAEEIPCAPSSVSRQVKYVEEALGIMLFDRPMRGERLKLTPTGSSVLPYIAQVVGQYESLEFYIDRLKGEAQEPYVVGLPLGRISIKTECLLMEKFYLYSPKHSIQFRFYLSQDIAACLQSREFDALLASRVFWTPDRNNRTEFSAIPGIKSSLLCYQPPCIAMRADHPLASHSEIDPVELKEHSFIMYYDPIKDGVHNGDIQTDGFLQHCKRSGFIPKLEIISKNISELRNVCVENYNWVYPTFQQNWMFPSNQIRAVPLKEPLYGSEYYLLTYIDRTDDTSKEIQHFFRKCFSAN